MALGAGVGVVMVVLAQAAFSLAHKKTLPCVVVGLFCSGEWPEVRGQPWRHSA